MSRMRQRWTLLPKLVGARHVTLQPFSLAHPITLAPMEEHTNFPFRLLMKQHGASLVCTERIDAADVARRERRALRLLHTTTQEKPRAGQISGADPAIMAEAARVVEEQGFDLIDLNFECPIRRLIGRGQGGALLADPPAIETIVAAVVKAVSIPVTLKIRSGPDAARETAPEIARRAESAGAAAVDVHVRSVAQAYVGGPDWSVVARVKQAVSIPVLGSGGIREAADTRRFLRETGADGVAIGRGCLGNPWIFRQSVALVQGLPGARPPTRWSAAGPCCNWSKANFDSTASPSPCAASPAQVAISPGHCPTSTSSARPCSRYATCRRFASW